MRVTTKLLQLSAAIAAIGACAAQAATTPAIHVLSNRADLISGGDVLVQVVPPAGLSASKLHVRLNGTDVTKELDVAGLKLVGLVTNLRLGGSETRATRPKACSRWTAGSTR
jgi:hypothetical protein